MDTLINLYAGLTGLWTKVAAWLPSIGGVGMVLKGAGGILIEASQATSMAGLVAVAQGLAHDPNLAMIGAGLLLLGIHTNIAAAHKAAKDAQSGVADG